MFGEIDCQFFFSSKNNLIGYQLGKLNITSEYSDETFRKKTAVSSKRVGNQKLSLSDIEVFLDFLCSVQCDIDILSLRVQYFHMVGFQ